MGMAASQARFLGLTARKSNVEYQAQQVNQQRTALANDSANLYNQMMALDVPVPPSTDEYYRTYYQLDNSADGYYKKDYTFQNATKTYDGTNRYSIVLTTSKEVIAPTTKSYNVSLTDTSDDGNIKKFSIQYVNSNSTQDLTYKANDLSPYTTETVTTNGTTTDRRVQSITPFQIYEADSSIRNFTTIYGEDPEGDYFFYQDNDGETYFMTKADLDVMLEGTSGVYSFDTTYPYDKEERITVEGRLETSDTGRFSSIAIDKNDTYPQGLSGKSFSISTITEKDEDGYADAYNDYKYEKDQYDHTIDEINAQTAIIQNEDKQLELRSKELETEQNAIKTEMDSVKKIISDNVEKTFNIFS